MSSGYQPNGEVDITNPPRGGSGLPSKKSYKIITQKICFSCGSRKENYCTELKKELQEPYILQGCMVVERNE